MTTGAGLGARAGVREGAGFRVTGEGAGVWTTGAGAGCDTGLGFVGVGAGLTAMGSGDGVVGTGSGETSASAGVAPHTGIAMAHSNARRVVRPAATERKPLAAVRPEGKGRAVI